MQDLWGDEPKKKANNFTEPAEELLKPKMWQPRTRPTRTSSKNQRAAVALPHGGQSYHPSDEAHQHALSIATATLQRKKEADRRFIEKQSITDVDYKGNLGTDKNWGDTDDDDDDANPDDIVPLGANVSRRTQKTRSQEIKAEFRKVKELKAKRKKKLSKSELAQQMRQSRAMRRQPDQRKQAEEVEQIDDIAAEVGAKLYRSHKLSQHRKKVKNLGQTTVAFGRHHHQPVALEVAPTQALTGSLRQMLNKSGAQAAVHPLVDRVKSLEARNMIPARMRHKYNTKRLVVQPGEVRIVKEPMGLRPHTE